jgi:regulatory protein
MTHTITAIKIQSRNRQRVNIFLDGQFAFGLSRFVAAWLQPGQELSDEKISELRFQDSQEVAYQRALKYLNFRVRSRAEVEGYLKEQDVPEAMAASIIERLEGLGLLDDRRFAQSWIENRNEYRPRSRRALAYELRQKGIANELIDQTLDEIAPDEVELAYQAARKISRKWQNYEYTKFRQRIAGHLARRGFSYEVITQTIDRLWGGDL